MKFVVVLVVVLVCVMVVTSRMRRNTPRSGSTLPENAPPAMQDVQAALAKGEKIRAIKIYRELTGTDLRTAKDAVDRIARGEDPAQLLRVDEEDDLGDVHAALARGEKIRAIKIYRELTGTDLRTAKDAVDRIARGENPSPQLRVDNEHDLGDVHAALARGEKIRAIKIYRELTGTDLRTAKDAVDRIARGEAATSIEKR